jgi:hypothetical protein
MFSMTDTFSIVMYKQMLENGVLANYQFILFQELTAELKGTSSSDHYCILRHDVDADIAAALTMAIVEHELGISATYFLMLRSPLYNLLGRSNYMAVEKILALGHAIGLHYDQGFDAQRGWTSAQTTYAVAQESEWLENQFNTQVAAVSFHQPGPAVLQGEVQTGTRINTYDRILFADFAYFSDSNRQFPLAQLADGHFTKAIAAYTPRNLQLLIHPIWWVYDDPSTEAVWNRAIRSNLWAMQHQLLETERAYGSERQFDISMKKCP